MIVVTGAPRTGTSIMMRTLITLGKESPAPKFLDYHNKIRDYNKDGFFEFAYEVVYGVKSPKYKGKVVKLFGGQFAQTPEKYIDKVIWCKRNDEDAIKSYEPIHKILKEELNPRVAYRLIDKLIKIIIENYDYLVVELEDFKKNPKKTIIDICDFLGIEKKENIMREAINNIKK